MTYRPPILVYGAITGRTPDEYEANREILRRTAKECAAKGWTPINIGDMFLGWENDPNCDYELFMDFSTSMIMSLGAQLGVPVCFAENWIFSGGATCDWHSCENYGVTHWESQDVPQADSGKIDVTGEVFRTICAQNAKGLSKYGARLHSDTEVDAKQFGKEEVADAVQYLTLLLMRMSE